ncbi:MAG: hypothetical protein SGCHY_003617 [Lobulomycetales sp.]
MDGNCPHEWEKWKTQRSTFIPDWNLDRSIDDTLFSDPFFLNDLFLARIPHVHYASSLPPLKDPIPSSCPKYVFVEPHRSRGLGHRLSNCFQGAMLAETFNLTLLVTNIDDSWEVQDHGSYPGMTEFLGLNLPTDLLLSETTITQTLKIPEPEIQDPDPATLEKYWPEIPSMISNASCHTLFDFHEFWPSGFAPAIPAFRRRIIPRHFARLAENHAWRTPGRLHVAVHVRVGDWTPSAPSHYIAQLAALLDRVSAPVTIHVITQNAKGAEPVFEFLAAKGVPVVRWIDSEMLAVIDVMLGSDVVLISDSSIAKHLAQMSIRPVVFAASARGVIRDKEDVVVDMWGTIDEALISEVVERLDVRWKALQCAAGFLNF